MAWPHHHCRRHYLACDCPLEHPDELLRVTYERHLNARKVCTDWQNGKRVCPDCRFLVNMNDHHLRCQTPTLRAPLADIAPPQEDQEDVGPTEGPEEPAAPAAATRAAALQDEQLTLLGEIVTMIHQTTTRDARRNHVAQRTLEQRMN